MRTRLLQLTGVATTTVAVVVLLQLAAAPAANQDQPATGAAGAEAQPGAASKTPWGEPDLQGLWSAEFVTPLQRPTTYANKEFFTDEERAELDRLRTDIVSQDKRGAQGSEQDVAGAYSAAIFAPPGPVGRRTSLIVDPSNGRLPSPTPEALTRRQEVNAYRLALLQATSVCKTDVMHCKGGTYGPPSPRRSEPPPHYLATRYPGGGTINRADGPEDRSPEERCLAGVMPNLGAQRIVRGPDGVDAAVDDHAGIPEAERQSEPDLHGTAVS